MNVKNQNQRFFLDTTLSYDELSKLQYFKVYRGRPTMLKFKHQNNTILIFTSKKCRIMGCGDQDQTLTLLSEITKGQIREKTIQSLTVVYNLPNKVNLYMSPINFEPELFCAGYLKFENGIHLNIFASGKLVFTGVKYIDQCFFILKEIYDFINY